MNPGEPYSPQGLFNAYQIPVSVVASRSLGWLAKILFGVLKWHARRSDRCFVRLDTLSRETGASTDSVERAIAELTAARLIERKRRGPGRENEYVFLWEPDHLSKSLKVPADSAKVRNQDSAKVRNQAATDSAEVRCKIPQKCGTDSAEVRSLLKEEENTPREGFKRNTHGAAETVVIVCDHFDELWEMSWSRKAKAAAKKAFRAKVTDESTWLRVRAAVQQQAPEMLRREPRYRPHLATWLNQERWNDEPDIPAQGALVRQSDKYAATSQLASDTFDALVLREVRNGKGQIH